MDIQDKGFERLGLTKQMVGSPSVCCYTRDLDKVSSSTPVLVLLHGYPQSSYMYQHRFPSDE